MGLLWSDFQANSIKRMRRGHECERGEQDMCIQLLNRQKYVCEKYVLLKRVKRGGEWVHIE